MQPEEAASRNSPPKAWIASLLTLLNPGLGQIYSGEVSRGLFFFAIYLLIGPVFFLIVIAGISLAPFNVVGGTVLWLSVFLYIAVDAAITAKRRRGARLTTKKFILYLILVMLIGRLVRTVISLSAMKPYNIPNASMRPALEIGDGILVSRSSYGIRAPISGSCLILCRTPERGDLIVFIFPEDRTKDFVKRVVAVGGEMIEIRDKNIYIDGKTVDDPHAYFDDETTAERIPVKDNYGPKKVPANHVFVLGDNRDKSYDSRFWGFVDVADVKGKAAVIYWSWDAEARLIRLERIGKAIE